MKATKTTNIMRAIIRWYGQDVSGKVGKIDMLQQLSIILWLAVSTQPQSETQLERHHKYTNMNGTY
jgi:hypothetical protein